MYVLIWNETVEHSKLATKNCNGNEYTIIYNEIYLTCNIIISRVSVCFFKQQTYKKKMKNKEIGSLKITFEAIQTNFG